MRTLKYSLLKTIILFRKYLFFIFIFFLYLLSCLEAMNVRYCLLVVLLVYYLKPIMLESKYVCVDYIFSCTQNVSKFILFVYFSFMNTPVMC